MTNTTGFQNIGNILQHKNTLKPPAYQWQDLALRIIQELRVPAFKRNSVFKICKDNSKDFVEKCLDDTKELAKGDTWKYFFKVASKK